MNAFRTNRLSKLLTLLTLVVVLGLYARRKPDHSDVALLTPSAARQDSYWSTDAAEEKQFDRAALQQAVWNADQIRNFYALLVVRDGTIVVERYFDRPCDRLFHLRSITKNVTSALTGILIQEGTLRDVDVPVQNYFRELTGDGKQQIVVRHLLNMSSGFDWDENAEIYPLVQNSVEQPILYLLSKGLKQPPGESFEYNSVSTHVLAGVLESASGMPLHKLAEEKLFGPLGIERYQWEKDPEGTTWGGFGLQLTARDLARFGQLYLQNGKWGDHQVVSESWVQQSATRQIKTGVEGSGYSNQWWCADIEEYDQPVYYGIGYGGQGLVIVPDKNMVVVAFQHHDVPPETARVQWNHLVENVVRPIYNAAK